MQKTILLVEDDPDDEALTVRALNVNHVANTVVVTRDGAEALEYLFCTGPYAAREPHPPAVVLLDLHLPKVDGLEVLRRLRADERLRTLPVVVLTSSDEKEDVARSYSLGANSYVRKPVEFSRFTESVRQLGTYWLMLNEAPQTGGCRPPLVTPDPRESAH